VGQPRWRTAVAEIGARLGRPVQAIAASILLVGVVVGGLVLLRPQPSASRAPAPAPAPAEPAEVGGPGTTAGRQQPEEVVVDVTGAVGRPGLVHLPRGSRAVDAVAAAGGPAADAALAGLNQARVVADGEQIRVPRAGEPPPAPAPTSTSTSRLPPAPVDINRATAAELDALPGVGPATAAAIVAWRQEHGDFRRVDDLGAVPGIGTTRLQRLRPFLRV